MREVKLGHKIKSKVGLLIDLGSFLINLGHVWACEGVHGPLEEFMDHS